mmetsp:Transcript_26773/g.79850  ORF Transcript_26773/g.79850 Transcript_26773/m.79850 type:complete len:262 (+) Transcript_26773:169-954(+)
MGPGQHLEVAGYLRVDLPEAARLVGRGLDRVAEGGGGGPGRRLRLPRQAPVAEVGRARPLGRRLVLLLRPRAPRAPQPDGPGLERHRRDGNYARRLPVLLRRPRRKLLDGLPGRGRQVRDGADEDHPELPQELVPRRPPGLGADRSPRAGPAALELRPPRGEDPGGGQKGLDEGADLVGAQVAGQTDDEARHLRQGDARRERAPAPGGVLLRVAPPRLRLDRPGGGRPRLRLPRVLLQGLPVLCAPWRDLGALGREPLAYC